MVEANTARNTIRVFFVRHGQTDYNVKKILQGHIDTDLNEEGLNQANLVGDAFSEIPIDSFYSSDLKRCRQTSKAIYDKLSVKQEIAFTDQLRERNMGVIEGKHIDEAVKYAEQYGKHFREFGEQSADFVERLTAILNKILHDNKENKNVLICTHGGTIRTALKILKYDDPHTVVYNTSVTSVDFDKHDFNKFTILDVGNTNHLGKGEFKVNDTRVR